MKFMKSQVYNQAKYYEIAFSFINPEKQADLFEKFIKKYSQRKVKKVLDIACGPALQLRELAKRGYNSHGLDSNLKMLSYLKEKARKENINVTIIKADMNNFKLINKVDFAYIMMGSIIYQKSNESFISHLNSVAGSLNFGGLYLIENLPINWASADFFKPQFWKMRDNGIEVKTTYKLSIKDALKQTAIQTIILEVSDKGRKKKFIDKDELKLLFPAEFKTLVEMQGEFEFLGFFERNNVKLLKKVSSDNIVILRKK